jgi:glyoxylase-like metal-dependent hydrolase (beta-lactamase superfamily II)
VLWDAALGDAPRFGTARCTAALDELLAAPDWQTQVAEVMPPELIGEIPLDGFGRIIGLPAGTTHLPWDGPRIRIIEHRGHAAGHAALLVEERGVLVAGDMLSDILIPFLDLGAHDPVGDYLDGLRALEAVADDVTVVIPGHGSVGGAAELRARIDRDRAYVEALGHPGSPVDPRVGPEATYGQDWLPAIDAWQREQIAARSGTGVSASVTEG